MGKIGSSTSATKKSSVRHSPRMLAGYCFRLDQITELVNVATESGRQIIGLEGLIGRRQEKPIDWSVQPAFDRRALI